jgi:hypothetical protein
MGRFQQGSLFKLERKSVPDVWVFRWYENTLGKRTYKQQIIGNVTKLRNRWEAEKTVIALRSSINAEVGTPKVYAISPPIIVCMNSPGSERRFQPLRIIAFYSSVTSNRVGEIVVRCGSYHGS